MWTHMMWEFVEQTKFADGNLVSQNGPERLVGQPPKSRAQRLATASERFLTGWCCWWVGRLFRGGSQKDHVFVRWPTVSAGFAVLVVVVLRLLVVFVFVGLQIQQATAPTQFPLFGLDWGVQALLVLAEGKWGFSLPDLQTTLS